MPVFLCFWQRGPKTTQESFTISILINSTSVLFIQQLPVEGLLCARHCSGHGQLKVNKTETPAFVELSAKGERVHKQTGKYGSEKCYGET